MNGAAEAPGAPVAQAPAVTYLGLGTSEVPGFLAKHIGLPPHSGLLVRSLDPDGPAGKAGFAEDDVIVKIDGKDVSSHRELAELVRTKKPGDTLKFDYIHEGKAGVRGVVLGEHQGGQAFGIAMPDGSALNYMLENLPADQARKVRESIERNMKNRENMENQRSNPALGFGMPGEMKDMEKRMEKMMEGAAEVAPQAMKGGGDKGGFHMGFSSTVRLLDNDGSVELKNKDGGNEVRVLDKTGKEVWSGPWDTEQDKAAAPKEIRERIGRLNLDSTFKGGIRLRGAPIAPDNGQ